VNSWASCTRTASVCCCLLVVFLAADSLEFPAEIFLATCVREALINSWDVKGLGYVKGYISWVGKVKSKRVGGKSR
jgi:hypothetical protein